jgi:hypothetical protein
LVRALIRVWLRAELTTRAWKRFPRNFLGKM